MKRPAVAAAAEITLDHNRRGKIRITPVGELLRAWRKRHKFSQVAAANKLQVSSRTLQNWEQGHREPKGFALQQLREKLRSG